jgi:hypothetical protein
MVERPVAASIVSAGEDRDRLDLFALEHSETHK